MKNEQNARIHATVTIIVGILAFVLEVTRVEAAILFMAVIMVFALEIMNTAVEKVCNLISIKENLKIAYIKDGTAGAVLITAVIATVVAILIFLPHIRALFG